MACMEKHNRKRWHITKVIIIFFGIVMLYMVNFKFTPDNGEAITFRYLPYSILYEFDFDLDEFHEELFKLYPVLLYDNHNKEKIPYYLIKVKGHYFPMAGCGPALLALPFFLIPILFFHFLPESFAIIFLSKLAASMLIALSAIFIYFAVRLLASRRKAWIITFIYAFCSGMWSLTSQALLTQTGSEFFIALSILFLVKGIKESKFVSYTGFSLASAILMRPTNIMIMFLITIYILHRHRDKFLRYIAYAIPVFLFIFGYNYYCHGSPFLFSLMIYNPFGAFYKTGSFNMWPTPFIQGFFGMLFSPSRGLFVYSPVFIFSFIGIALVWIRKGELIFKYFCGAVIVLIIIHAKWYDWWGGWTFGCRMLNDAIPFLSILLLPAMDLFKKNRKMVIVFILTVVIAFCVQAIGAFLYDNSWNSDPNIDTHQYRLWLWKNSQLRYYVYRFLQK